MKDKVYGQTFRRSFLSDWSDQDLKEKAEATKNEILAEFEAYLKHGLVDQNVPEGEPRKLYKDFVITEIEAYPVELVHEYHNYREDQLVLKIWFQPCG